MKPRKTISVYVLLVGVMGLLIVGGIFSFQLIDEATKNQLPAAQRELVKPLDGKLETEVIENLTKRKVFSREDLIIVPTVVLVPSAAPTASVSALSTEAPLASTSAVATTEGQINKK